MQNQPTEAGPKRLEAFHSPIATLAQPKVVLAAAGLFGLAVDLFVRPLSWIGLALIGLATAPWWLQAWSQRSSASPPPRAAMPIAAAEPAAASRPEPRTVSAGQRSPAAHPAPRETPPTAAVTRPPATSARAPDGETRAAATRPPPAGSQPQRSPQAPVAPRPVRPETAG